MVEQLQLPVKNSNHVSTRNSIPTGTVATVTISGVVGIWRSWSHGLDAAYCYDAPPDAGYYPFNPFKSYTSKHQSRQETAEQFITIIGPGLALNPPISHFASGTSQDLLTQSGSAFLFAWLCVALGQYLGLSALVCCSHSGPRSPLCGPDSFPIPDVRFHVQTCH